VYQLRIHAITLIEKFIFAIFPLYLIIADTLRYNRSTLAADDCRTISAGLRLLWDFLWAVEKTLSEWVQAVRQLEQTRSLSFPAGLIGSDVALPNNNLVFEFATGRSALGKFTIY